MNEPLQNHPAQFNGWNDYSTHLAALECAPDWRRVEVSAPTNTIGLEEIWFEHLPDNQVWVLIEPDPPYAGTWKVR